MAILLTHCIPLVFCKDVPMLTFNVSEKWHCRWRFRHHHPHFYREADLEYGNKQQYVHLDILRRKFTGPEDDRYISPKSGRIRKLLVQSTYSGEGNSTYRRTRINNAGGQMVSLAGWATDRPSTICGWIWGFVKYILASIYIGMFVSGLICLSCI